MDDQTELEDANETEDDGPGLADRTEQLADIAIGKLRSSIHIQTLQEDASRTAGTIRRLKSWSLKVIVGLFILAAGSGIVIVLFGSPPVGRLPDWYMHIAMYLVLFSFLFLYIQACERRKSLNRVLYCVVNIVGISTFVWVLHDRISPRFLVVDIQDNQAPVLRGAMPELWVPIVLLSMVALGILLHQLTVRMRKLPDA